MVLAYRPEWHDMSEFVVHFARDYEGKSAYDVVMSILWARVVRAVNPFGIARDRAPSPESQRTACFSEIPLHLISRLADRRGTYGLGFTKRFLLENGGGPIWYVEHGGPAHTAIEALLAQALHSTEPLHEPIWGLTPFIDTPMDYQGGSYRFEWEREWRHVGDLPFEVRDVQFLIVPERQHGLAQGFFYQAWQDNTGPAYFCPIIDPYWDLRQVRDTFQNHDYSWMDESLNRSGT
jgi:hypothetical protein